MIIFNIFMLQGIRPLRIRRLNAIHFGGNSTLSSLKINLTPGLQKGSEELPQPWNVKGIEGTRVGFCQ